MEVIPYKQQQHKVAFARAGYPPKQSNVWNYENGYPPNQSNVWDFEDGKNKKKYIAEIAKIKVLVG
jgi:hypothetical protein